MKIPAAAFTAANKLGRMAGQVFQGTKGLANSPLAIPIAVGLGQAGIAGIHGRMTGYENPTHSGIPGALGHTVLGMSPLAGLAYYAGQRTGSQNQMRDFYNQYQPIMQAAQGMDAQSLTLPMPGYNFVPGNI
tara:strand:- start:285 stop:680 length:396 start_codon:yes stop_codon:yes gene_type:complete